MLSRTEIWNELNALLGVVGLGLFNLDLPANDGGTLKIYITKGSPKEGGVSHEDCGQVVRLIDTHPVLNQLRERFTIEVSSPGLNRRLELPEHFKDAVGERVKLKVRLETPERAASEGGTAGSPNTVIVGELVGFDGNYLEVLLENDHNSKRFALSSVQKANVEYLFGEA